MEKELSIKIIIELPESPFRSFGAGIKGWAKAKIKKVIANNLLNKINRFFKFLVDLVEISISRSNLTLVNSIFLYLLKLNK